MVVGVDGTRGSGAASRPAAQEAHYRNTPLVAVMAYSGEGTLGAPAARPVATLRTAEDERVIIEEILRDVVRDAGRPGRGGGPSGHPRPSRTRVR